MAKFKPVIKMTIASTELKIQIQKDRPSDTDRLMAERLFSGGFHDEPELNDALYNYRKACDNYLRKQKENV